MNPLAILVALIGAAMAGLAYMSVRMMPSVPANVMVLYYAVISIPIVLFGSWFLLDDWKVWGNGLFSGWDYFMFLLTGLGGFGGQYFTNMGLQRETAATGTLVTCTQIVWTYIFEIAILHEAINGWSILGTALILGFMLIVGYIKMHQEPEPIDTVAAESEALICTSYRSTGEGSAALLASIRSAGSYIPGLIREE
jgi:drug/metabolite transporter (DMT)-like permease